VSHWMPKDAPVGDARRVDEYTDGELALCLEHAEHRIGALPNDSPDRPRLQEWLRAMLAERDARQVLRAADARAAAERLAAGPAPAYGSPEFPQRGA